MPAIRPNRREDSTAIADIYNDAVLNSVATFDTEPKTSDDRESRLAGHDARHPVLVAEIDGLVVGWASLSAYSDRPAYFRHGRNLAPKAFFDVYDNLSPEDLKP